MAVNAYARAVTDRIVVPVARTLVRLGATANWLTFTGFVLTLVGAVVAASGQRFAGALVITVSSLLDALDGSVARLRGTTGPLGAFYDSVTDRFSDVVVFGAAAWLVRDDAVLFVVALVGLAAGQGTSYMRAKAESLGWNATVGLIERPERLVVLIVGLAFPLLLAPALWVLAIGGLVTVAQRARAVLRQARSA